MRSKSKPITHTWLDHEAYIECRVMGGHGWGRAFDYSLDGREMHVSYRCQKCGMLKHLWYDVWTGKYTSTPWYDGPRGYYIDWQGRHVIRKRELRVMGLRRFIKNHHITSNRKRHVKRTALTHRST